MLVCIIDDEILVLKATSCAVAEAMPDAEIHTFIKSSEFLSFAQDNRIDIVFSDINMRGMSGIELAEKLKSIQPQINIIFVTGYEDYKSDAMDLHASGYLMKPIVADDVRRELAFLRYPIQSTKRITVNCFGNFSVTLNGSPLHFAYTKTEELFAYLIDRRGASISYGELSAILWEEDSHFSYLKKLRADLIDTFEKAGFPDIIISNRGFLCVDISKIDCDYIGYLNKVPNGRNTFRGEYMNQYSWAENTLGTLMNDLN